MSLETRDAARVALARAFEEAATMPGTLLPHELLAGLTQVGGRIVAEIVRGADEDALAGSDAGPALYIVEHSIDATVLGLSIGRRIVARQDLDDLGTGLFLQDIGKLALPPNLVLKPGPLAPDERALMMQHPVLGLTFLRDDALPGLAKSVVRSHHERWDGSGYPSGLVADEIPLFARIAAVADVFHAVTSARYHAEPVSRSEAIELICTGSGSAFDPMVVEAFLDVAAR